MGLDLKLLRRRGSKEGWASASLRLGKRTGRVAVGLVLAKSVPAAALLVTVSLRVRGPVVLLCVCHNVEDYLFYKICDNLNNSIKT